MTETTKPITITGITNLVVVYIVWGSTYLAIRVAVQEDGGFAPFLLGFSRVVVGGSLLLLWAAIRKERLLPTKNEAVTLILSGLLMWVGGNGLVNWAEQRTDSGLAALIIAATPIWVAIIEAFVDREVPSWRMIASLMIGFVGIIVLTAPTLQHGLTGDWLSVIALLLAGLSWGAGSVFQSRRKIHLSTGVSAGYQQLVGGAGFLALIFLSGERWTALSSEVWLAWGYLVIFGSILAFTSYIRAINLLPLKIVATYAYVNPVIAVFLGWLILNEQVTGWLLGGAALVLLGVAGVFNERYRE